MALLRHANVKYDDTQLSQQNNADGLLTLAHSTDPHKLPVYFCAMPFLLENTIIRDIIENAATLRPQVVSVYISARTHEQYPDLMLSIQAYCIHYEAIINLESIEVISEDQTIAESELSIIVGSESLLRATLKPETQNRGRTIVYVPTDLHEQFNLHELLELNFTQTLTTVVSAGEGSFLADQAYGDCIVRALDLAIAHDAQLFHWIEGNASHLASHQRDACSQLLMRYCSSAAINPPSLLHDSESALACVANLAGGKLKQADAAAIVLMLKTHVSVLANLIPAGADARVWHLLSTLGHTLYFNELTKQAAVTAKMLFASNPSALLTSIGELSPIQIIEPNQVEAAMLWMEEQHTRQPR